MHSRRQFLRVGGACAVAGLARPTASLRAQIDPTAPAAAVSPPQSLAVRYLGKQFLGNNVNVTGADGATSLVLPSGKSVWVFGDTVEGPFTSIRSLDLAPLRSNTGAIVPPQNASKGIREFSFLTTPDGRRPRQLIPYAQDEAPAKTRLWAIHGTAIGRRVYLFYHRISLLNGVDVFEDFRLEGMGLARASCEDLQFTRLAGPDGTREFWKTDQPSFGVWVEQTKDYVYLWGSLMTGMFLARAKLHEIEDLAAYEYLVEAPTERRPDVRPRWDHKFTPTAVLFDSVPNEMSAAYNPHLRQYVAIHALGREGQIVMRTAPRRTGPWSGPQVVYEVERADAADRVYAAKEHPELARDGGRRIYITYVNSATYIPELIEVTLP